MRDLLFDASVRATLLLGFAALATASRRSSAAFRHRVWATALLALPTLPIASILAPTWTLAVLPVGQPVPTPIRPPIPDEPAAPPQSTLPPPFVLDPPHSKASEPPTLLLRREPGPTRPDAWLIGWASGLALSLAPLAVGLAANGLRRRSSRQLAGVWSPLLAEVRQAFGIRRRVDLRLGGSATIPSTWGVVRPVVLLPAEAESWPDPTRRVVLAHELAHVRRHDWLVHLLSRLAASVFWFHPLAWYAIHRLRIECEHASDDAVLATGERPADYAERLLDLARRLRAPRCAAAVGMARRNHLEGRIIALFDDRRSHAALDRRRSRLLAFVAIFLVLATATARLGRRATASETAGEFLHQPGPAAQPPGRERTVTVRVKARDDGLPIGGADVRIEPGGRGAATDADGVVVFRSVASGALRFQVEADGLARLAREIRTEEGADVDLEFRLGLGAEVVGVVRDALGKSIPRARVTCRHRDMLGLGADFYDSSVLSNAEGRYRLTNVPRGAELLLTATDPGSLPKSTPIAVGGPSKTLDLVLEARPFGGAAAGLVVDRDGRPLAEADAVNVASTGEIVRARTGPDGRFLLKDVRADRSGDKVVWVRKPGFAIARTVVAVGPIEKPAETTIALEPGGPFEGLVVDDEGRPLSQVIVAADALGPFDSSVSTGEDGRFRFESVAAPVTDLTFSKPRYTDSGLVVPPAGPDDVPRYVLGSAGWFSGLVTDARTGRPIPDFRVEIAPCPNPRPGGPTPRILPRWAGGWDLSSGDGRFRMGCLRPGDPVAVKVSAPGYKSAVIERVLGVRESELRPDEYKLDRESGPALTVRVLAREGDAPATAAVQEAAKPRAPGPANGRIVGRVATGVGGGPASGAEVSIHLAPTKDESGAWAGEVLRTSKTGPDGSFAFEGVPPGRYRVWASSAGLVSPRDVDRCPAVPVFEGEAPTLVELTLAPAVALSVKVTSRSDGRPIAGAEVRPRGAFPQAFRTDAQGVAAVGGLTPGSWTLQVRADGFATQEQLLGVDARPDAGAAFLLEPGAGLEGVVRDPSGKPVPGVDLNVVRFGGSRSGSLDYTRTDRDGRYRFTGLPRDEGLTLTTWKPGYVPANRRFVTSEAETSVDLVLESRPYGGAIAGVVVDREGRPIAGAELLNTTGIPEESVRTTSGPDGRFRLDGLYTNRSGAKTLGVRAKGYAPIELTVEVGPADQPAERTVRLEPGHRVEGRVIDDAGRPLSGVLVSYAEGVVPFRIRQTTGEDGRFRFDALPADAGIDFRKAGYSEVRRRKIPLDGADPVEVRLAAKGVILGRAFDAGTGAPLSSFRVRLDFPRERKPGDPNGGFSRDAMDGFDFAAPDGRFRLDGLDVGGVVLVLVSAPGREEAAADRVVVAKPEEAAVGEYRLATIDPASVDLYAGRFVDAGGAPVRGAQVRLLAVRPSDDPRVQARRRFFDWNGAVYGRPAPRPQGERYLDAVTDAQGRFAFEGVPKGTEASLYWWGGGVAPQSEKGLDRLDGPAKAAIEIKAQPAARIVVTVDRKRWPNLGRVAVSAARAEAPPGVILVQSDRQDRFEFDGLAALEYTIRLEAPPDRLAPPDPKGMAKPLDSRVVRLRPGETQQVDFK
ncbi:carboxypeptidase regulatory-like domain-containing protein [Paludisphaera mucosa]|uniref:Carboxypeptidase regulatory-like domain-containing protein n=1 Tax=Paludisphaera mucosa TaxID=3030827 RepID=A0ABT6FCZ4_9BACT|nr:carboxypeptidase regulatory-like domain-containing protein [Paludisphaera mucosa]MDG3005230.1 carboxypeptidase regulatory-like domain-containing protein [Paludisphaera mucosa]